MVLQGGRRLEQRFLVPLRRQQHNQRHVRVVPVRVHVRIEAPAACRLQGRHGLLGSHVADHHSMLQLQRPKEVDQLDDKSLSDVQLRGRPPAVVDDGDVPLEQKVLHEIAAVVRPHNGQRLGAKCAAVFAKLLVLPLRPQPDAIGAGVVARQPPAVSGVRLGQGLEFCVKSGLSCRRRGPDLHLHHNVVVPQQRLLVQGRVVPVAVRVQRDRVPSRLLHVLSHNRGEGAIPVQSRRHAVVDGREHVGGRVRRDEAGPSILPEPLIQVFLALQQAGRRREGALQRILQGYHQPAARVLRVTDGREAIDGGLVEDLVKDASPVGYPPILRIHRLLPVQVPLHLSHRVRTFRCAPLHFLHGRADVDLRVDERVRPRQQALIAEALKHDAGGIHAIGLLLLVLLYLVLGGLELKRSPRGAHPGLLSRRADGQR
mmetsp:Transcript_584/g.2134  ORF Transcript_584/g.2134 Transcript_584/m.2134 type:complete len:429 (-) Transcript_584:1165-2451(-)